MQEVLNTLNEFANWVEEVLMPVDENVWMTPITKGKWTVHQLMAHLYFWDKYTLEEMLPDMKQDASLQFIEIQTLNDQAIAYSHSISKAEVLKRFLDTRKLLIKSFSEQWNDDLIFMLDGHPSNMIGYLSIFSHHDQEHKAQIINFLQSL